MSLWALLSGGEMRRLRRYCTEGLQDLPLPDGDFSITALVANMAAVRGRSIRLIEVDDSTSDLRGACGLRVRGRRTTYILFRRRPTPNQTEHTILHELAHEWLDHTTNLSPEELTPAIPNAVWRSIVAEAGPDAVMQALARYGTAEEREAELSASLIKIMIRERATSGSDPISLLESSLSHPVAPPRQSARKL